MAYTSLAALVAAVAANAGINPAEHAQTAYSVVGSLEQGRKAGPPRIVWVPESATIAPADRDETTLSQSAFKRSLTCGVYVLGQDYAQAETELHALLGGLARTQPVVCRPTDEEHRDHSLTGAARYEIKLSVEVDIPVFREVYTAGEIESTAHTATLTEP